MKNVLPKFIVFVTAIMVVGMLLAPRLNRPVEADPITENIIEAAVVNYENSTSPLVIPNVSIDADSPFILVQIASRDEDGDVPNQIDYPGGSATADAADGFGDVLVQSFFLTNPNPGFGDLEIQLTGDVEDMTVSYISLKRIDYDAGPLTSTVMVNSGSNNTTLTNDGESLTPQEALITAFITSVNQVNLSAGENTTLQATANGLGYSLGLAHTLEDDPPMTELTSGSNADWLAQGYKVLFLEPEEEQTPVFNFTTAPTSPSPVSYLTFNGTVSDASGDQITRIYYTLDGGGEIDLPALDGTYDSSSEDFTLVLGPYPDENKQVRFYAENDNAEISNEYLFDIDIENPTSAPACSLSNHPSPTADTTPSYHATCTNPEGITKVEYRIYDFIEGTIVDWTDIVTPTVGNWGDTSIEVDFTSPVALDDGTVEVKIKAYNTTGKFHAIGEEPIDVVIIEAVDSSPPVISLNPILPNPTVDPRPYFTGNCSDKQPFDTNSNISIIQYQLDGGAWTAVPALDGALDSTLENFSVRLDSLAVGAHSVTVRCTDAAGNSTQVAGTNKTQNFTVTAPISVTPEDTFMQETFDDDARNSVNDTTAIWGNGIIRLRETMGFSKQALNTTNFGAQYGNFFASLYRVRRGTGNLIWYAKRTTITSFNTATNTSTEYDLSGNGISEIYDIAQIESGGKILAAVASDTGLLLFNVSDNIRTFYDIAGYNSGNFRPDYIQADTRNGRVGFFVRHIDPNGSGTANVIYIHTQGTFNNLADDIFAWIESSPGYDLSDVITMYFNPNENTLYVGANDEGLIKINDNNTPTNTADDVLLKHTTGAGIPLDGINGITQDPSTGHIFLTNVEVTTDLLVLDQKGTPFNGADDEFVRLASQAQLFQKQVFDLEFVPGKEYVGGQLFLRTNQGELIYYNTNGSYLETSDDTIIELNIAGAVYPMSVSGFVVSDYNTIYLNLDRSGFYRVSLDRGWHDSGEAIIISSPPENRLLVDNIELQSVDINPSTNPNGTQVDNSAGQGLRYYISVDDGVTWIETSIGDIKNIDQEDYRFRFKIALSEYSGTYTPVVDEFQLRYASYQDADQAEVNTFVVTANPTSLLNTQNFSLTIEAVDALGYVVPTFNGDVTLELQDFDDSEVQTYLNKTSATLVNGTATFTDTNINTQGEYRIRAYDGTYAGLSSKITISKYIPVPTLSFSADKYRVNKGDSVTLEWASANLDTLEIDNGIGAVDLTGSRVVSPEQTTTYTISGVGEGGSLSSSLEIVVLTPGTDTPDTTDTEETPPLTPETPGEGEPLPKLELIVPFNSKTVNIGEKVEISWQTRGNPDRVFVDYLNSNSALNGKFEFFPIQDTRITITAYRGREQVSEVIEIKVTNIVVFSNAGVMLSLSRETIVPLVAAAILAAFSALLFGPVSDSLKVIGVLFGFVSRRKIKYWGVVYDLISYKPIPFATIRLFSQNELIGQVVTDLEGRYGILIEKAGLYKLYATNSDYEPVVRDLRISEELIEDIGMRRLDAPNNIFLRIRSAVQTNKRTMIFVVKYILLALMLAGFVFTLYAVSQSPLLINFIFLAVYFVLFIINLTSLLKRAKNIGRVVELPVKSPLPGSSVRFYQNAAQIDLGITNANGQIKQNLKPGEYQVVLQKAGYDEVRTDVALNEGGKLSADLGMRRASAQPNAATPRPKRFGEL